MSGIAAIIHFDGRPVAPGDITAMTQAMAHRGPDGITLHENGSVALGHCMMRTTTESLEEVQPVVNIRSDVWLVVDGWLDNWEELRAEVLRSGGVLRNRSDAELILAAYELWGEDCVLHMGGDFAFVIWDAKRQTAFCARDRIGNKPLVYFQSNSTLVVASEARAVLALPWIPRVLNEESLAERLTGEWTSKSRTLWKDVSRLVASHRLAGTRAGIRIDRYWSPDVAARINYRRDEDYFAHYRELFVDSVRRSARSHRAVAYEVSGGLDSSAIFCVAKQLLDGGGLPAPAVNAYTLDFSGDPRADEIEYVRAVGDHLGVHIREIAPALMSLRWYAKQALDSCDQSTFPNGTMGHGLKGAAQGANSRVIVNGGGDEWITGSRAYYAEELAAGRWNHLACCLAADMRSLGAGATLHAFLRHGIFMLLPQGMQDFMRSVVRATRRNEPERGWLSQELRTRTHSFGETKLADPMTIGQRGLLEFYYLDAMKDWGREQDEQLNSGFNLETRRPMDTPALVQFAVSVPERLRLRGDTFKFIHVNALRNWMPPKVVDRKTKAEFSSVMRDALDQLEDWFCATAGRTYPQYVDGRGLARLFRYYKDNTLVGWPVWVLWSVYGCLHPEFIERYSYRRNRCQQ